MSLDFSGLLGLATEGGSFWLPEQSSTLAGGHDNLFHFIFYLSAFFFALIVAAMILFVVRYRRRSDEQRTSPIRGNFKLEVAWAVVPAVLLLVMFVWGFKGYLAASVPPSDAIEVRVVAQRWKWSFSYPAYGIETERLVVPVDRPVRLTMSSVDVIHSFYVPAFRVKRDVLPNRYTVAWFQATQTGEYDLLCAEYCGQQHSAMVATVEVVSPDEFQPRLNELGGAGLSPIAAGERLFRLRGCQGCHNNQPDHSGSAVGPDLWNAFGRRETLSDGTTVVIDDNYIRHSILNPNAQVVQGFNEGIMPAFAGQLDETQINHLIDYVRSLSENPPGDTAAAGDTGGAANGADTQGTDGGQGGSGE